MLKIFFLLSLISFCCTTLAAAVRIAAVNYRLEGGESLDLQFKRLERIAEDAKAKKVSYLLLPELMVLNLFPVKPKDSEVPALLEKLASHAESYEAFLSSLSRKHKLHILGGSVVIKKQNGFINRAFLLQPDGQVLHQDKVYPTPWERKTGFVGGEKIQLFKSKDFSFVILICHDAEFASLSQSLAKLRPEVIFVPSQTDDVSGLKRVHRTSAARAVEHMSYVVMTGTSGNAEAPWHSFVGQNFLFTPQNKYFENAESSGPFNQETLSVFEIDLKKLKDSRSDPSQVYPARDETKD